MPTFLSSPTFYRNRQVSSRTKNCMSWLGLWPYIVQEEWLLWVLGLHSINIHMCCPHVSTFSWTYVLWYCFSKMPYQFLRGHSLRLRETKSDIFILNKNIAFHWGLKTNILLLRNFLGNLIAIQILQYKEYLTSRLAASSSQNLQWYCMHFLLTVRFVHFFFLCCFNG